MSNANTSPKRFGAVSLVLILWTLAFTGAAFGETRVLQLGTRTFTVNRTTSDGIPVIHFWKAKMPTGERSNAAGFHVLKEAEHFDVWKPTDRSEGVYNHYAALFVHEGRFYAMWGNHGHRENGGGQRVLFSMSEDGRVWKSPAELFPPPGPIKEGRGMYLAPDRWVEVDGRLYAVVYVHGSGASSYPIARELADKGARLGDPLLLRDDLPKKARLPEFMPTSSYHSVSAKKIDQWYEENDTISWWARHDNKGIPYQGVDGAKLIESFAFRSKEGMVACMRDYSTHAKGSDRRSSNRIYACFSDGKGGWSAMYPTDIPDSHSRAQVRRSPDGRLLLVGNQIAPRFDEGLYLVRDPLTIAVSPDGEFFTDVYALRSGGEAVPKHRFTGTPGSGPAGYGYPSMVLHDGMIYVLYSINKEDMAVTIVPLASIVGKQ